MRFYTSCSLLDVPNSTESFKKNISIRIKQLLRGKLRYYLLNASLLKCFLYLLSPPTTQKLSLSTMEIYFLKLNLRKIISSTVNERWRKFVFIANDSGFDGISNENRRPSSDYASLQFVMSFVNYSKISASRVVFHNKQQVLRITGQLMIL